MGLSRRRAGVGLDTDRYIGELLLPLVAGGPITVRGPIDADDLAALIDARATLPGLAELAEARRLVVGRFLADADAPAIDDDALRLSVAIHNLCWLLAHPRHDESRGIVGKVAAFSARIATLPPPADELALCARHAVCARLPGMARKDVRVRFWAGERTFRGEAPPPRLLRWQSVRRVVEEHTTVDLFAEALASVPGRSIVVALLGASPLTDLLGLSRTDPPPELLRGARWLAAPRIARALADEYLARGLAAVEAPLSTALLSLCNRPDAHDEVATATCFHSHLHLLDLIARPPRDREGHVQVLRGYTQGRERAAADGFGLHAAADRIGLGRPADVARDPLLARNVDAYVEACAELVGSRRLQELTGVLARGAGEHARLAEG